MQILTSASRIKIAAFLLLALPLWASPARGDEAQPLQLYEDKIKAALIYDFLKYTNWSANSLSKSHNNLQLCLLGDDSVDSYLYPLRGRTVQEYTITITLVKSLDKTGECNMVFVHRDHESALPQILQRFSGKQILTVSDIDQFTSQGGMVEIHKQNDHIEFFINKKVVDQSGLSIQGRLLRLARPAAE